MWSQRVFVPMSPVLADRRFGLALAGAAAIQLGLMALHLPGWECPFLRITGVPCPGCGLSRATMLLLKGELRGSLHYHAFAPVFILAFILVVLSLALPKSITQPAISRAELFERQTGITVLILAGLILYWLARLLFLQSAFVQLIRG